MDMNKLTVIGNIRSIRKVGASTQFQVVAELFDTTPSNEHQLITQAIPCQADGKLGEIITKYLKEGNKIYVEGWLKMMKTKATMVVDNMILLGQKFNSKGA